VDSYDLNSDDIYWYDKLIEKYHDEDFRRIQIIEHMRSYVLGLKINGMNVFKADSNSSYITRKFH